MRRIIAALVFGLTLWLAWEIFARFSGGSFAGVLRLIASLPFAVSLQLLALTVVFFALDWVRFRSTLAALGYRLRPLQGFQLACVSYFVTTLTPTAELHTPAMIYLLGRRGVPAPRALAATVTKSVYMTLWICVFAYAALFVDRTVPVPEALRTSLPFLALPLLGFSIFLGAAAFIPERVSAWCERGGARLEERSPFRKVLHAIGASTESVAKIGRSGRIEHWTCHAASIAFLFVYVTIGYVAAHAFGIDVSGPRAFTIFSTSLMVAYLSPVPGSIGVTELTTSYMLDPDLTQAGMATSLVLRVLCSYGITVPGGLLLARAVWGGPAEPLARRGDC